MHMCILKHFISSVGNMHSVMTKNYSGGAALGIHTDTHTGTQNVLTTFKTLTYTKTDFEF